MHELQQALPVARARCSARVHSDLLSLLQVDARQLEPPGVQYQRYVHVYAPPALTGGLETGVCSAQSPGDNSALIKCVQ